MKINLFKLIVVSGCLLIGYGVFGIVDSKSKQDEALVEAKEMIDINPENVQDKKQMYEELKIKKGSIGILEIPKLKKELPIVAGTDEDELARGVGHYNGTGLPGEEKQILLSGHRDTVFRQLGELSNNDVLNIQMPYGTYSYRINETKIVNADDRTVIDYNQEDEVLVLSTCYPFNYIGDAPERYIIYAVPIK